MELGFEITTRAVGDQVRHNLLLLWKNREQEEQKKKVVAKSAYLSTHRAWIERELTIIRIMGYLLLQII